MLKLYRENGVLYFETKMELRFPITIKGIEYSKKDNVSFEEAEVVHALLERNAAVKISIDGVFVKPNLYELGRDLENKKYTVIDGLPVKEEPVNDKKEQQQHQQQKQNNYQDNNNQKDKNRKPRNGQNESFEEGDK